MSSGERIGSRAGAVAGALAAVLSACGGEGGAITVSAASLPAGTPSAYVGCASCHGVAGEGVGGAFPPIAGSPLLGGPPERLAVIVLHGMEGPIERPGRVWSLAMPASPDLSDAQVAELVTWMRGRFAQAGDTVTATGVARLRHRFEGRRARWTERELLATWPASP